jgi:hypothetical protein
MRLQPRRASPAADPRWAEFFITSLVDFVVWTSRPTGYVDKEAAGCVVTALRPMGQATANAQRAALEIVREAQQVDEALLPLLLMPREIAPTVPIHMAVLPPKRRARLSPYNPNWSPAVRAWHTSTAVH